ncbi:MAG: thiamine biosynthesis protein thio [Gammaproteobacteria bacterium RIFCSPHIGHO2_12_FULL_37_34]|nr:MAG: thiamine biosynthesis protein thio [Gammaproteobacteria bacterium RIFCSPHIGHO2_12_FULL_37_34]
MKAAIVGAGVIGRLLALLLVNNGHEISIFDQDGDDGIKSCSMAAAGLLTPVTELDKSDILIYELGMLAIAQHWPTILNVLQSPIYFQQMGSLAVTHPKDHAEMDHFISFISEKLKNNPMAFKKLDQSMMLQLEPGLSKFTYAYYFPKEGQIDNQAVLTELKQWLHAKHVMWYSHTFVEHVQAFEVHYHQSCMKFDMVFDCRGIGAKSIFHDLQGVRGELIWLYAPHVKIAHPVRFLHPRYSLYVVPRPNHIYLIGASEILSEDQCAISVRTTLELLTAAYYLHPGFAEATILKTVTHCRPTLSHYLPKIKYADGFIAVNGLYRHGFLIAPTLVIEIMRWLTKGISSLQYAQLWEQL